jgi:hypothetical protein
MRSVYPRFEQDIPRSIIDAGGVAMPIEEGCRASIGRRFQNRAVDHTAAEHRSFMRYALVYTVASKHADARH